MILFHNISFLKEIKAIEVETGIKLGMYDDWEDFVYYGKGFLLVDHKIYGLSIDRFSLKEFPESLGSDDLVV